MKILVRNFYWRYCDVVVAIVECMQKCMENIKWKAATQFTIRRFFTFNIKFIFYRMRFWFRNCVENVTIKQKALKDVVKEFVFHAQNQI